MHKLISSILLIAFIFTQSAWAEPSAQPRRSCMRVQEAVEATGDAKGATASMAGEMQGPSGRHKDPMSVAEYEKMFVELQGIVDGAVMKVIRETAEEYALSVLVIDRARRNQRLWGAILKKFNVRILIAESVLEAEQNGYFDDPNLAFIINNDRQQKIDISTHIKNEFTDLVEGMTFKGADQIIKEALWGYIVSRDLKRSV